MTMSEALNGLEAARPEDRTEAGAPGATPLLVAGMHRSGTSAVARVLNLLGADIPGEVVPGFLGNDLGHWEPQAVVDLHEAMLAAARTNVNSVFGPAAGWFESAAAEAFVVRLTEVLARPFGAGGMHVIKDPRMGLFLPVWREALARLDAAPRVVLPFRDPLEVAASLQLRQMKVYPDAVWPLERGLLLWLRYVLDAEAASRGLPRTFIAFDALLEDWRSQTKRMAEQLALSWPDTDTQAQIDGFLSREHVHAIRRPLRGVVVDLAHDVFELLARSVADPDAHSDGYDAARRRLDAACGLFEPYVEALELRLGEQPALRTEYVDFLRRAPEPEPPTEADTAELEAALVEADGERRQALLQRGLVRQRALAAECAELSALNEALLGAARRERTAGDAERSETDAERVDALTRLANEIAADQVDALRRALETERRDRSQSEAAAARAAASLEARAEARAQALESQASRQRAQLAVAGRDLADVRFALQQVEALAVNSARSEALIRGSTSWRLTAPLRGVVRRLRRFR